ncbi:unnamed protein product [Parascedosporium putredinis]|uniref:Uncharacterized protein n=1 Tax=Parascedosporium putredinis TaxID=1442378 RepID=A0A9P1H538_9PEZI|nr:unnamed protein product [Parascedosporium putredinis]CAI7996125.1 unnamed protein product [Parascedosporium putredinis]
MLFSLALSVFATLAAAQRPDPDPGRRDPIILERSGGFNIGGKVIDHPTRPAQDQPRHVAQLQHPDVAEPVGRRAGLQGHVFAARLPRVPLGRATPGPRGLELRALQLRPGLPRPEQLLAWNFGPSPLDWWEDVQFPTENREYFWEQATGGRYIEFDNVPNVHMQSEAAAISADTGMNGDSIVYLTNSAAGLRSMMTVAKSNTTNIKGIVMYETVGIVYPEGYGVEQSNGPFGPFVIPLEDFEKLTKLKEIQFIFGDHRDETHLYLQQAREVAAIINDLGGNASVLKLGEDAGLWGSTHVSFADMDNDKVAELLDDFLARNGLDEYQD